LGYTPEDVTDVIVTHLDLDHAGGIADFPWARIHVNEDELAVARARPRWIHRQRYRPSQLSESARWYPFSRGGGEPWMGFQTVRELNGLPPEFLLVDLPGHSTGHTGIAIQDGDRTLLHAGDAYYDHRSLLPGVPWPLGLRLFERVVHEDLGRAKETVSGLSKALRQDARLAIVCSHDANETPLL
jgi:glyoxylase-like metal-dependent hydrolase (beta-lactamase superfamily II)